MKLDINPRGNGACPICRHAETCRLRAALTDSVRPMGRKETTMEITVYSCPDFSERD